MNDIEAEIMRDKDMLTYTFIKHGTVERAEELYRICRLN